MKTITTKRPGLFITLEGPEGCGKSTQAPLLAARLRGTGREVVCVREPGGTATGEAIRHVLQHHESGEAVCPEAELLLFLASRAQLVRHVIRPALKRGACVVCDRFADSTTAYQGYGRGLDVEQAIALNEFAVQGVMPDLTILLDVDIGTGFRRLRKRNRERKVRRDRIERAARTFHERVRRGYLALARRWPERFRVVDARGEISEVEERIWAAISRAGGAVLCRSLVSDPHQSVSETTP